MSLRYQQIASLNDRLGLVLLLIRAEHDLIMLAYQHVLIGTLFHAQHFGELQRHDFS